MPERDWQRDLELCLRATPGPWENDNGDLLDGNGKPLQYFTKILPPSFGPFWCNKADPDFIAQAREGWPAALEELVRLQKENRELKERIQELAEENKELNMLFEMQQRRVQKAIKLWQQATGNKDVFPDLGELVEWLLNEKKETT